MDGFLMFGYIQWFGDLVTMEWWSDILLRDGFAEYFSSKALNYVLPEQQEYIMVSKNCTKVMPKIWNF